MNMDAHADKVLPILRMLETTDLSERRIAELADVAPTTVSRYRRIQHEKGYKLSYLETLSPRELRRRFDHARRWRISRPVPDWPDVHRRMRKPGANLMQIWAEENDRHPEGYSYPRFLAFYNAFEYRLTPMLRQQRRAGELVYVGFMESTVPWLNLATGMKEEAVLFFGVLGCSYYTFISAADSRSPKNWLDLHGQVFESTAGVPAAVAPGYVPAISGRDLAYSEAYEDLAIHYRTHIVPEFPHAPQTEREVPMAVRVATRWIAWRLRKLKFGSIEEINAAIKPLLMQLNQKPFRRLPGCRASWLQEMERPALRPLPAKSYQERLSAPWTPPEPSGDEAWLRGCTEEWARSIGPNASAFVRLLFERHPLQKALDLCEVLRSLAHRSGDEHFETACHRARATGKPTMKSLRTLLRRVVAERKPRDGLVEATTTIIGGNDDNQIQRR